MVLYRKYGLFLEIFIRTCNNFTFDLFNYIQSLTFCNSFSIKARFFSTKICYTYKTKAFNHTYISFRKFSFFSCCPTNIQLSTHKITLSCCIVITKKKFGHFFLQNNTKKGQVLCVAKGKRKQETACFKHPCRTYIHVNIFLCVNINIGKC